jgi:hypothetical protein
MRLPFFLLGSMLLTSSAYAQLGLRAGGNVTGLVTRHQGGGSSTDANSHVGYQVGLYYQLALTKHLSLVPEVQFSRESQQVHAMNSDYADAGFSSEYELRRSYLSVPVLLRAALGPVYLEAGPQASFLVGGHGDGTTLTAGFNPSSYPVDQAATDRYRRIDAGFAVGVGVKLPASLGLSLRAYQGLVTMDRPHTVYRPAAMPYAAGYNYRQTLQASLTYQL